MHRPKPTKQYITELCGGDHMLVESAHHGLYELRLAPFYPNLDFQEMLAFAAGSWRARKQDISGFRRQMEGKSIYEVFSRVFSSAMPWLNSRKSIPAGHQEMHKQINPFRDKKLEQRLARVESASLDRLVKGLEKGTNHYEFMCNDRLTGIPGIVIMTFHNVYPKKGRIVPAYAAEIARMTKEYPAEFEALPAHNAAESPKIIQPELFE